MLTAIPVDPDADTAREWAINELSKREYTEGGESWLESFWRWLTDLFNNVGRMGDGLGVPGVIFFVVLGLGVVALIIWIVVGPLRRSRNASGPDGIFGGDRRDAAALKSDADAAAAVGDWADALLFMYRAIVRSLDERGAVTVHSGLTAHEAAEQGGLALPALAQDIAADADAFDRARYGHALATQQSYLHAAATFAAIPRAAKSRVVTS
jgi:hypothetical protein